MGGAATADNGPTDLPSRAPKKSPSAPTNRGICSILYIVANIYTPISLPFSKCGRCAARILSNVSPKEPTDGATDSPSRTRTTSPSVQPTEVVRVQFSTYTVANGVTLVSFLHSQNNGVTPRSIEILQRNRRTSRSIFHPSARQNILPPDL